MSHVTRVVAGVVFAFAIVAEELNAQVQWTQRILLSRGAAPAAFDSARDRLVLFTRELITRAPETWEWDGTAWRFRTPANAPTSDADHAMTYDLVRQRVVLFGGRTILNVPLAETWEWDGTEWSRRIPANVPPARRLHAMAFDLRRIRTVLFGGSGAAGPLADTWEWDGLDWTQRPTASPIARDGHAMAFDLASGSTVLFGGRTGTTLRDDTWLYDGATWSEVLPSLKPSPREGHGMAGDFRGRVLLYGGATGAVSTVARPTADTWEWNGSTWQQIGTPVALGARMDVALAFDPARSAVLAFGGRGTDVPHGDLWRHDGTTWSRVAPSEVPPPRGGVASAWDSARARFVLFGGRRLSFTSDHWEWDGARWREVSGPLPPSRENGALAYDSLRSRLVLFGGGPLAMADTWEFDGASWRQIQTPVAPSARMFHAMAFDSARGEVVLCGGRGDDRIARPDTWEWNGARWTLRSAAGVPARIQHGMAFDASRGRTVFYGGATSPEFSVVADTWEWDGASWTLRVAASPPGVRQEAPLAYDAQRGRVVMFTGGFMRPPETWEWDGSAWVVRAPWSASPVLRMGQAFAYDGARGVSTMFGGVVGGGILGQDVWEYGPVHRAVTAPFGAACPGTVGTPALVPQTGQPWLGSTVVLRVAPVPPPSVAVLWVGTSRTTWSGAPLPRALDALGMPGCTLHASIDATSFAAATGGAATFTLAIPNLPALLGLEVFAQAAALDPAANAFGAVTSNALALRVGGR